MYRVPLYLITSYAYALYQESLENSILYIIYNNSKQTRKYYAAAYSTLFYVLYLYKICSSCCCCCWGEHFRVPLFNFFNWGKKVLFSIVDCLYIVHLFLYFSSSSSKAFYWYYIEQEEHHDHGGPHRRGFIQHHPIQNPLVPCIFSVCCGIFYYSLILYTYALPLIIYKCCVRALLPPGF